MAEESLKFKSSLDDSAFQAGLKSMDKGVQHNAKQFEKYQGRMADMAKQTSNKFAAIGKDFASGISGAVVGGAIGGGVGGAVAAGVTQLIDIYSKIGELNKEARGRFAEGERGAGAETAMQSRLKGIQDFNSELSKQKGLESAISAAKGDQASEYAKQKMALLDTQEALGKITADEKRRQQIEIDRASSQMKLSERELQISRDRSESEARIAKLQAEMKIAKNASLSGEEGIAYAGRKQMRVLQKMIADEQTRFALYEEQNKALESQRKTVEQIAKSRADVQAEQEKLEWIKKVGEEREKQGRRDEQRMKDNEQANEDVQKAIKSGRALADKLETGRLAGLKAQQEARKSEISRRADEIQKGPDVRRQDRRDKLDRDRAESRAERDIAREEREARRRGHEPIPLREEQKRKTTGDGKGDKEVVELGDKSLSSIKDFIKSLFVK